MNGPALLQRRWVQWVLIYVCWTFIAVFYTTQVGLQRTWAGASFDWWHVLRTELLYSYLWAALTLAIMRIDDGVANRDNLPTLYPAGTCYDVTGMVGSFNGAGQIFPRSTADIVEVSCN